MLLQLYAEIISILIRIPTNQPWPRLYPWNTPRPL